MEWRWILGITRRDLCDCGGEGVRAGIHTLAYKMIHRYTKQKAHKHSIYWFGSHTPWIPLSVTMCVWVCVCVFAVCVLIVWYSTEKQCTSYYGTTLYSTTVVRVVCYCAVLRFRPCLLFVS